MIEGIVAVLLSFHLVHLALLPIGGNDVRAVGDR